VRTRRLISYIKGTLVEKTPTRIVVDANGIGHEIFIPLSSYDALGLVGEATQVYTHFHVREDAQELFGFATPKERWLFRLLISVSGIGPRSALGILSGASVEGFCDAIANEHADFLTAISGVGKKTAQRLILELKSKVSQEEVHLVGVGAGKLPVKDTISEAVQALIALGFHSNVARKTVERCAAEAAKDLSVEELIRSALKNA
jgi:holliday junction DNA helicase RuvA